MIVKQLCREYVNTVSLIRLDGSATTEELQACRALRQRIVNTAGLSPDANVAQFILDVMCGKVRDEVANRGE